MASVSSLTSSSSSSSSTSSLYGTRNVLSGLASGLDTESMIENLVSSYQTKIDSISQKVTTAGWEQEAYRSIITKMASFRDDYCSYTSSTNLLSASFFNKATTTTAGGDNAACVSASGKSTSDIEIDGIKQLATAAQYIASGNLLDTNSTTPTISASSAVDLSGTVTTSNITGYMTFSYGESSSASITFSESDNITTADGLVSAIKNKLSGSTTGAKISVSYENSTGAISFSDGQNAGNSVYISSASSSLQSTLGFTAGSSATSITADSDTAFTTTETLESLLSDATMKFTLNGTSKTVDLPTTDEISTYVSENSGKSPAAFVALLQDAVDDKFGSGAITVSNASSDSSTLQLKFTSASGSTLTAYSSINSQLGLGSGTATSYFNVSTTLADLKNAKGNSLLSSLTANSDGTYDFTLNGVKIGSYSTSTTVESIMSDIKNNEDAGVTVSYSTLTNKFVFTATDTGSAGKIEMGSGLAQSMFGTATSSAAQKVDTDDDGTADTVYSQFTAGQDAILTATVNDEEISLTRSSNAVTIDGMTITLKNTFGYSSDGTLDSTADPITFTTAADSDTIISAISSMIDDYNTMVTEIHSAYTTQPLEKSDGSNYEPLTDSDEEDMSESAIEAYEKKAKTGLLMGDSDLSTLYSKLLSAITPTGTDGVALSNIGITTKYSEGLTTLSLDKDTLKTALETDPDSVKNVFTKSTDSGSSTNGLMTNLKTQMDNYAAITGSTKGILVQKAGSELSSSSLLDNELQDKIDRYEDQIEDWQDKMSDKVDYYTSKFTAMETLIAQMNSQSATISSMLG